MRFLVQFFASFFSRLAVFTRSAVQWVLNHSFIAKCVSLPLFFITIIRSAIRLFSYALEMSELFRAHVASVVSGIPMGGFSVFSALQFLNSVFPVSESIILVFALAGLWAGVLSIKAIAWLYNKVPFKAS